MRSKTIGREGRTVSAVRPFRFAKGFVSLNNLCDPFRTERNTWLCVAFRYCLPCVKAFAKAVFDYSAIAALTLMLYMLIKKYCVVGTFQL